MALGLSPKVRNTIIFLFILSSLTAFVFYNDERRDNYATDEDPFGLDEFQSVGFPSQDMMTRLLAEPSFGTMPLRDRDILMKDMER